jgi:hypothetical protein
LPIKKEEAKKISIFEIPNPNKSIFFGIWNLEFGIWNL